MFLQVNYKALGKKSYMEKKMGSVLFTTDPWYILFPSPLFAL